MVFGIAYSAPYEFDESRSRQEVFDVQEETIVFMNSEGDNKFGINILVFSIIRKQATTAITLKTKRHGMGGARHDVSCTPRQTCLFQIQSVQ